jgi:hypothetical protein
MRASVARPILQTTDLGHYIDILSMNKMCYIIHMSDVLGFACYADQLVRVFTSGCLETQHSECRCWNHS